MNYYQFIYSGRDNMGCNSYRQYTLIVPALDEESAVRVLKTRVECENKLSEWSHTLVTIVGFCERDEAQYNEQEGLRVSREAQSLKLKELNSYLRK